MLIQSALRQTYRRETWTTILIDLFPDRRFQPRETPYRISAEHQKVEAAWQLGTLGLNDGNVAVIEVETKDTVNLSRNRIELRNYIAQLIDEAGTHAVLAVFHQPGKDEWRLTYASRRTTLDPETFAVTHSETSPRRFTFLLGPGESCKTAAGRLKELEGKESITLEELERAFSVERLNKDFFKRYKEFYERFTAHLLSSENAAATRKAFGIKPEDDPKKQDKDDKPVRDFSKKLLGRLVFLHFLQRKRWLGCPKGTIDWSGGEENFIADFFQKAKAAGDADRFHSKYLTPLFFEALNTPDRKGDLFPLTGTRLPYLNGGLFEEDAPALCALDFPPLLFEELLGFFGEYHFTIDENDPEDHEVGIDPEMLGHIFENLLEDNKDKGAFYTPKAIVQYMARESLRHYLETHLGPDPEIAILLAEKDLTRLAKDGFVKQNAKRIATLLEDVKICDPAIGSGAFPIGLLQEILWTRLTLNWELNTPEDRARLKRDIIRNSIHGVDLDPGAVEIARLRFWLALVVDEEIPRPLPNLDYKIMQGDGLLESFEGIDLSRIASGQQTGHSLVAVIGSQGEFALDDAKNQMELQVSERSEKIAAMLRDYFSETDPVRKKQRHAAIDREILKHLDHAIGFERDRIEALLDQQRKLLAGKIARTKSWTKQKGERLVENYKTELAALEQKAAKLRVLQQSTERPFFLWHLYFQEVFENGGFDIMIANPPYVRQEAIRHYKPLLKKEGYECYGGTADLYVYFYERSLKFLKNGGTLCFISSNSILNSDFGRPLRSHLLTNSSLTHVIDFAEAPVFEAVTEPVIIQARKGAVEESQQVVTLKWQINWRISEVSKSWVDHHGSAMDQKEMTDEVWRLESEESLSLLAKLRGVGKSLGEYVDGKFYYGIKTGYNKAYLISKNDREQLIQKHPSSERVIVPFLRGKDIRKWEPEFAENYLIRIESSANYTHPWTGKPLKEAEAIFSKELPAIHHRMRGFRSELIKREDQGAYFWELRSCAYWEEFSKPKLVYQEINRTSVFAYDQAGYLANNKVFIVPGAGWDVLALLNSKLGVWFIHTFSGVPLGGFLALQTPIMAAFPIPPLPLKTKPASPPSPSGPRDSPNPATPTRSAPPSARSTASSLISSTSLPAKSR